MDWTFGYGRNGTTSSSLHNYTLDLRILSHNVQSLLGKIQYYRAQTHSAKFNVIGLQETASRSSQVTKADNFLRLAVAAQQGHGGIELWLSTMYPIAWISNRPVFWDLNNVIIIHQDPQLLVARAKVPGLGVFVLTVGHAPHSGHPWETKQAWWTKLRTTLGKITESCFHILMLDANAQVGSITSDAVGSFAQADEDENGSLLRNLADHLNNWLPSTFWHLGDPCTWYSPAAKQRQGRRLDFICIPSAWSSLYTESWAASELDAGHKNIDHIAVGLNVSGPLKGHQTVKSGKAKIDWQQIRAINDDGIWKDIFQSLPTFPWWYDTHLHWQSMQEALMAALQRLFPQQGKQPRRHYISEASWTLRSTRNYHRRLWRNGKEGLDRLIIQRGFQTWKEDRHIQDSGSDFLIQSIKLALKIVNAGSYIRQLSQTLKKQINVDKNQFLITIAEQAESDPANIYKILRKAGVSSQRTKRTTPLPGLLKEDGEPCRNETELKDRWLRHFADIEGGHPVEPEGLLQLCAVEEIQHERSPLRSWAEIPSLLELEAGFRRCRAHKAPGPDLIVPEICKKAAKWFARWAYSLFAKMVTYRAEPLAHKGGVLHAAWKRRRPMNDPTSFRGILVSSQVAKIFHSTFRTKAINTFKCNADPLQYGGLPGKAVTQAAQSCRLQQSICHQQGYSTAILFVDIKSAYYTQRRHKLDQDSAPPCSENPQDPDGGAAGPLRAPHDVPTGCSGTRGGR